MKKYLADFFDSFEYEKNDAEFLLSAYCKIEQNRDALCLWNEAINIYNNDINCDYTQITELADSAGIKAGVHPYTAELLIFVCLSKRLKELYKERSLSEEMFHNTMLDLRYKVEECKTVRGIVGSFVAYWFAGFFNLTRFALGRLQFEIKPFGETYEKDGRKLLPDSPVINVHIPRSLAPLDKESCDRSFELAKEFFKEKTGGVCAFVCNSWLLFPENKNILSKESNTYKFMIRFDIVKWNYNKDGKDLWRLFDTEDRNFNRLPADSSMRRAYIDYLKKGGVLGSGYGVFFA